MKKMLATVCVLVAATVATARSGFTWEELQAIDQKWPQAKVTTTGLRFVVEREGSGALPQSGDTVKVLYKGMFFDGRIFDQALDPSAPFTFRLGRGQIIAGWEEGIAMMRVGEKRILIVPYELAYGSRGYPPHIPRRASLVFEVEMIAIEPKAASSSSSQP